MPPQLGYASAFSAVLLVVVAMLLFAYGRLSRRAERFASITGKGYRPRPFRLGRLRWLGGVVIAANTLLVLVLPVAAIAWMAFQPFVRPMRWVGLRSLSPKNMAIVLSSPYYVGLAVNTVIAATAAATAVMLLTALTGWLAARQWRFGRVLEQLTTVPLVFPGLVLGVALLELALRSPVPVYGTLWLVSAAFVVRYMPYGMRYAYAGATQIHAELEQAAMVSGASVPQMLRRIMAPLMAPALASGWLFVFLIAAKEMSVPLVLAGPDSQTIAVAIFNLWSNGQVGEGAALGLLWTAAMTVISAILYGTMRHQSRKTFGH